MRRRKLTKPLLLGIGLTLGLAARMTFAAEQPIKVGVLHSL